MPQFQENGDLVFAPEERMIPLPSYRPTEDPLRMTPDFQSCAARATCAMGSGGKIRNVMWRCQVKWEWVNPKACATCDIPETDRHYP